MKKIIAVLLAVLCAFSFSACDNENSSSENSTTEAAATTTTEAQAEETTGETTEGATEESTKAPSGAEDISGADVSKTSKEDPIALGDWAAIATYAVEDEIYHNVNVRVTKVTTTSEDEDYVNEALELNNKCSSDYGQIKVADLKLPSDCEVCILDYEVNIPADFPVGKLGTVASPNFSFSISNMKGGGIPNADGTATYIGLTSVRSLKTEKDSKYEPGNTYSCRCYFAMVKGYEDFVISTRAYPEGTKDVYEAESYDVYFAKK